jgi:glycosyltransferase involved in cell wall biosynthesis
MGRTRKPELSIVLLSYNRIELTKKVLKNLLNDIISVDFELIVVDNHSTDGTKEYLEALHDPRVSLVLNEANRYFGGGNNCGLEQCRGKFVLFTQNDMTFKPHSMRNFIDLCELLPDAGCLGIGGGFISRLGVIKEISEWWRNPLRQFDYIPVDFVSGCCMLFERSLLEKHQIRFDINFKLYWEDVDICHQTRMSGSSIYMIHNGLIGTRHLRSGTITTLLGVKERERIRAESEKHYRDKWDMFYKDSRNLVSGIEYRSFFSNLKLVAEGNGRVAEEIADHKDDAREVAPFEFLEFQGEDEKAIAGYKQLIKKNPDNFLAYRNLCRSISRSVDRDETRQVISDFRSCLERRPPVVLRRQLFTYIQSALLKIARDYANTGNYESAHAYYDELQEIAQTAPTIALCEIEKAKIKYLTGNYEESEEEMKAWLQKNEFFDLDPMMFTAAHFYLGEMAYERNELDVAADRYYMAVTIDPNHERASNRLREISKRKDKSQDDRA